MTDILSHVYVTVHFSTKYSYNEAFEQSNKKRDSKGLHDYKKYSGLLFDDIVLVYYN